MRSTVELPTWLRRRAAPIAGSILFVGGTWWLLKTGALPVVPPSDSWSSVVSWAAPAYVALFLLLHVVRCVRWMLLLDGGCRPPLRLSMSIGMVGYAALILLPFRLGEAARPGLLHSRAGVPLGTSAGVFGAERVIDGFVLSLVLLLGLLCSDRLSPLPERIGDLPIPAAIIPGLAWTGLAAFGCLSLFMVAFYLWRQPFLRLLRAVLGRVSLRIADRVAGAAESIAAGLVFLRTGPTAALFGLVTVAYWGLNTLAVWLLLRGTGIVSPSLAEPAVILGVLGLGLIVPNAPGFFGTFQISVYSAMVLFFPLDQVTQRGAAFVFLLYVIQLGVILLAAGAALCFGFRRWQPGAQPTVTSSTGKVHSS